MQDLGRLMVVCGALLLTVGALVMLAGRIGLPLGRLPGDVALQGKHFSFYAPIATCVLLSLVLSLLFWLLSHLRR